MHSNWGVIEDYSGCHGWRGKWTNGCWTWFGLFWCWEKYGEEVLWPHRPKNSIEKDWYREGGRNAARGRTCKDLVAGFEIMDEAGHGRCIQTGDWSEKVVWTIQSHCTADSAIWVERKAIKPWLNDFKSLNSWHKLHYSANSGLAGCWATTNTTSIALGLHTMWRATWKPWMLRYVIVNTRWLIINQYFPVLNARANVGVMNATWHAWLHI